MQGRGHAVRVSEPTRLVLVPGLGLDGRSSARLRRRCAADVVLVPGIGLAEPVPPRELAAPETGPVVLVGHSQEKRPSPHPRTRAASRGRPECPFR